jgi:hypothetical protein
VSVALGVLKRLDQDLDRDLARAALPEKVDRAMQVDLWPGSEKDSLVPRVAGSHELGQAPPGNFRRFEDAWLRLCCRHALIQPQLRPTGTSLTTGPAAPKG